MTPDHSMGVGSCIPEHGNVELNTVRTIRPLGLDFGAYWREPLLYS